MAKRILVLEDDVEVREVITETASRLGFDVISENSWIEARERLDKEPVDALIVDASFDHGSGVRALGFFEAKYGDAKALVITRSVKEQGPRIDWAKTITAWAA